MKRLCTFLFLPVLAAAAETPDGVRLFSESIEPLLQKHCYECHSHAKEKAKGGLVLDSRGGWLTGGDSGAAVVPGKPNESPLLEAIAYKNPDLKMPPKHRLSKQEVAQFRDWIAAGAPDPRDAPAGMALPGEKKPYPVSADALWSLQPVVNPPVPAVEDGAWPRGGLDRFILARLEQEKLHPVADAGPEHLLRRLSFDLTGLPPSPEEVRAFAAAHRADSQAAIRDAVDRLLDSPQFGERWGRHWLDTARYADTSGGGRDWVMRQAFRYRDWVIDAFNSDLPYDRFLREQIAGDLLPADDWQQRERQQVATGFLAIGPRPLPPFGGKKTDEEAWLEVLPDWENDMIDAVTRGMLAFGVACARCHDHKFDPIPQTDFYALAGIFRSTELRGAPVRAEGSGPAGTHLPLEPWQWITGRPEEVARAESLMADWQAMDGDRAEIREELGRLNNALRKANILRRRDQSQLTEEERAQVQAIPALRKQISAATQARKQPLQTDAPLPDVRLAAGAREAKAATNVPLLVKGEWDRPAQTVPRGLLTTVSLPGDFAIPAEESGRLQLAAWIAHPQNPLTARVAVNRIWHQLFGRGLVASLDNFGITGDKPTHPELLDWLAWRFMHEHGWSVKQMIREIATSRTYQLACVHDEAGFAADPGVETFWRARPRRLEAEAVRDALLAVAGRLEPGRPAENPLAKTGYSNKTQADVDAQRVESENHRSIYVPVVRGRLTEIQGLFDQPVSEEVNSERNVSTLPTQSLFFLNSPFVAEIAGTVADSLLRDPALADPAARLDELYRRLLARDPTAAERAADEALLERMQVSGGELPDTRKAWSALCLSLLLSSEFLYRF